MNSSDTDKLNLTNTSTSKSEAFAKQNPTKSNAIEIPSISLPKGGGALKSIDEKFQVNAANGTSTLNIAIPFSKSRSDFAPSLSLNYNSGSGNSAFGLGWNISLPSVRRRTEKLLPKYQDALESDIFQLAGIEDMVLKLVQDARGEWQPDVFKTGNYLIKRYRPRIEGAFTLIEQITSSSGMYWKTTGKDNTVIFYGLSAEGRVADPSDPSRIFEWLPQISYDDKGNCFQFLYVAEDLVNVPNLLHEGNRINGNQGISNTYLKKVAYGNISPYSQGPLGGTADPYLPVIPNDKEYLFSLVLDYGDHDPDIPTINPTTNWGSRLDPFSNCKAGFDIRTYRLCRRFLLFHNFIELDANPVLVKSLDLFYQNYDFQTVADLSILKLVEADFITSVTETGWVGNQVNGYQHSSYPPVTFTYQLPVWNSAVEDVTSQNSMNIPEGLSSVYQFTDLYNEGIAGILSEQSEGWYYNSNMGDGVFTPAYLIAPKPSFSGLQSGGLQLQSLTGDGRKFIVSTIRPNLGYFELTDQEQWLPFMSFEKYPAIDIKDPNVKFIDLNGDGMPDIILSEEQIFTWYPAAGTIGYDSPELATKPFDEEKGPAIVFADPVQSIFLADMTGDGLTDIVRIRNGDISYWSNLGYGLFGAKVNMKDAPLFDSLDQFNPAYIHLADINGTGVTDILYLGQNKLRAWLNLSGNAWGKPFEVPAFPDTASPNQLSVTDFLGNGTTCIVWSSPLANNADTPMRYIDLMGGNKPYLMKAYNNGMGKQVEMVYKSSTWFYLQDKLAGTPWITKLPFPVQCLVSTIIKDSVSGTQYGSSYSYHHGYYDHPEKEFRGFGRVEQTDTDTFDTNALADQFPVLTKTWFHTGAYFGIDRILHHFADEYFHNTAFTEYHLPEPILPQNLSPTETREAVRACKGMTLRQEVYALDSDINPTLANYPYSVAEHNNNISLVQRQAENQYAVFLSTESENITYHYERNPADPRIAHTLNTAFDTYGNIVDSYSVVYARQPVNPLNPGGITLPGSRSLPPAVITEQANTYIVYAHHGYTGEIISALTYRLPVACEAIAYQLTGLAPAANYYSIGDFTNTAAASALIKLKHQRIIFLKDDLVKPLPLNSMDTLGMVYQQYHLAFNATVKGLNPSVNSAKLSGAQYIKSDNYKGLGYFPAADANGEWWVPSGSINYLNGGVPLPFYLPYQYLDAYNNATTLQYAKWLLIQSVTDPIPIGNATSVGSFNYRILSPQTIIDPNGNATDFRYDRLGMLVAIAQRGKGEGDVFSAAFTADLTSAQIAGFFSNPFTNGPVLLQGATTRYIYDFVSGGPFSTGVIARHIHANQTPDSRANIAPVPYQFTFEYTDGLGRTAMKKVQADVYTGNLALSVGCDGGVAPIHRWIGNGKTVYNNKGKPVMQYEPFFNTIPAYENAPVNGVSPVLHYDPVGRVVRTDFPDGSFSNTEFDAWVEIVYDQNDNVKSGSWYTQSLASADTLQQDAANKASAHDSTPAANHLDTLGRNFYRVSFNIAGSIQGFYETQKVLDLENNPLSVIDAMGNTLMQWDYDLLNRPIHQVSMDAGERWMLNDCMDKPFYQWDGNSGNNFVYQYQYDNLHRPTNSYVKINGTTYLVAYNVYGEGIVIGGVADNVNNLRTKLYKQFDQTGLITHYLYDFKGNLVQSSRTLAKAYKSANPFLPVINWSGTGADTIVLENEEFTTIVQYDALNRPILQVRPFIPLTPGSILGPPYDKATINSSDVIIPGYGESGALTTVNVYQGSGAVPTTYVTRICRNEKGQRQCIQYGNNTVTKYYYDSNTFRLTRLVTTANIGTVIVQDLNYYYDPIGNITYQLDKAQPAVFFSGQKVLSDGDYTYDALYRLISAKGREHIGQNKVDEARVNSSYRNYPFDTMTPLAAPTDAKAIRFYTQLYNYDKAGNMTKLKHVAGSGSYTRIFAYNNNDADRLAFGIPGATQKNNQLIATTIGSNVSQTYKYDDHGNMLNLPHLPSMAWNYKDALVSVTQQSVANGVTGQTVFYNYDGGGMRVRKVTEGASGSMPPKLSERIYLGNFEIYRTFDAFGNVTLQRESLHIMDDKTRIALTDNKTIDTGSTDTTTPNTWYTRYQYGNHLGSVAFELDSSAATVSYEEYHPYGTTSYQAKDAVLDVPEKRYRYTGKERDEESGLYYHGARYYAPWFCRWLSCDPKISFTISSYTYSQDSPIVFVDPNGMEAENPNKNPAPHIPNISPEIRKAYRQALEDKLNQYDLETTRQNVVEKVLDFNRERGRDILEYNVAAFDKAAIGAKKGDYIVPSYHQPYFGADTELLPGYKTQFIDYKSFSPEQLESLEPAAKSQALINAVQATINVITAVGSVAAGAAARGKTTNQIRNLPVAPETTQLALPPPRSPGVIPSETVNTPYGLAIQEQTSKALTIRANLGDITVYRQGKFGFQLTNDAQFWSVNHPGATPDYAQGTGMAGGQEIDWHIAGTVREDANAVVRFSPPLGPNKGGDVEVVTPPGGFTYKWFHMP